MIERARRSRPAIAALRRRSATSQAGPSTHRSPYPTAHHLSIDVAPVFHADSPNEPTVAINIDDLDIDDLPKDLVAQRRPRTIAPGLSLLWCVYFRESYAVLFVI